MLKTFKQSSSIKININDEYLSLFSDKIFKKRIETNVKNARFAFLGSTNYIFIDGPNFQTGAEYINNLISRIEYFEITAGMKNTLIKNRGAVLKEINEDESIKLTINNNYIYIYTFNSNIKTKDSNDNKESTETIKNSTSIKDFYSEKIEMCKQKIGTFIENFYEKNFEMNIEDKYIRFIIGKNGSMLKKIQNETNTEIIIDINDNVLIISGEQSDIKNAVNYIEKLKKIFSK